ncbi:MAG: ABC transporter permease [Gracilimonas sp.]|uniref:ABC transporter permease n=1 Tax=Gracilimonas sp. TaxID=1974203 RepID=UPI001AFDAA17|nr:ABC transporter permease [Gracilimonas sp.]MBO6585353.1 ABC transporter permease [Gracilimonas sp.]MBO6616349.1 ABC transporter permease [Gracilimonas sp.]
MIRNYIKIAFRHLAKNKSYTFINTVGLGVGLAACIIIGLWVNYELSYDDYHADSERIYRVLNGDVAATPPTLAPALKNDYPEIAPNVVRFWPIKSPSDITSEDKQFAERNITFTDPDIFDVFTHPLILGNKETALSSPNRMVISKSMAEKYFGPENPLGKTLTMWGRDLEVTGVFENVPLNSHHRYEFLVPIELLETFMGSMMENWTWAGFYTYILLPENVSPSLVETAIASTFDKYTEDNFLTPQLQPLNDIYFEKAEKDIAATGNFNYVVILVTIAIIVLVLACINFMNLSTAYSTMRKKEVGMRKTLGAQRGQLIGQFLGEAIVLSLMGLSLALILVEISLPFFSNFTGSPLSMPYQQNWIAITGFVGLALLVGTLSGSYPAFFLSNFQPVNVLKNTGRTSSSGGNLRKGLVVFQFAISIFLIVAALTVYSQMNFMQKKDLGFSDEKIIITGAENYQAMKAELEKMPEIEQVSAAYNVPGQRLPLYPIRTTGMASDSLPTIRTLRVNPGLMETLGMEMALGRSFDEEVSTDASRAFVINQAAVNYFGWEDPIGKELSWYDFSKDGSSFEVAKQGSVIGVVNDFNYASLHNPIEPLVIHVSNHINMAVIKLSAGSSERTLSQIRETWNSVTPGSHFWYYFLSDDLDRQYGAEQKLGQVFGGLTLLALFIACLGLFGLTTYSTRQRTKEIGIRKVMGADIKQIILMLNMEVLKMVALSLVIAIPIAWFVMSRWLADFAYRIEIGPRIFFLAGMSALVIALLTVSWQSIKASVTPPVESLRSE